MSAPIEEPNGDITQGQSVEDNTEGTGNADPQPVAEQQPEGHPAWKEILDLLPDEFHPLITPKLKGWDDGVQTRFQNLQSQYEPYKPFIDNEVDPDYLQQAIGLAAAIEQDPQRVYDALAEAYGYGQGVADTTGTSGQSDEDSDDDDPVAARLAEHERMLEQMAEAFLADTNNRQEVENQQTLDAYMATLHTAYDKAGGFDEGFVLTQIANGVDGRKAVENFQEAVKKFSGGAGLPATSSPANAQAPPVMGGSGGLPSNRTDPSALSDADTGKLVAEMLKAANEE